MKTIVICLGFLLSMDVQAAIQKKDSKQEEYLNTIDDRILSQLSRKFKGAKVKCSDSCTNRIRAHLIDKQKIILSSIRYDHDSGDGRAYFDASWIDDSGRERAIKFGVPFNAWKTVPVAKRRIAPTEKLNKELFRFEEIDIAKGMGRQYKDLILGQTTKFDSLEARNTILEGHFVLSNGVQRIPLVRRGDSVKVILVGTGLKLSTSGTVLKEAYAGQKIPVMTSRNKRQLSGVLKKNGSVEVKL